MGVHSYMYASEHDNYCLPVCPFTYKSVKYHAPLLCVGNMMIAFQSVPYAIASTSLIIVKP